MKKLILALLLIALALRLPQLNGSFWLDEAAQALESARPLSQQLDIIPDFQPPLLHLLLHFAMRLKFIGKTEWFLRLVGALVPGLITILATVKIGQKLFSKRAGLVAGFLLATNSFHIFYSQELRPYSLPTMIGALSWWWLTGQIKDFDAADGKPNRKLSSWLVFSLLTALGLYASYLYPFLLIGQLVYLFWAKRAYLGKFLAASGLSILTFLPWLPTFLKQLQAGQALRQTIPGWENVVSLSQAKAPILTLAKLIFGVVNLEINFKFIAIALILLLLTLILAYKTNLQKLKLVLAWLIVPLLTSWLVSFWVPVVRPKRLLFIQPALMLVFAQVITHAWTSFKQSVARSLALALALLLLAINLSSTYQYFTNQVYQRENWRGLYELIDTRFPQNETVVVFSFDKPFAPWHWYNQGSFPSLATGKNHVGEVENLTFKLKPIYNYQYVLVFDYLRDLTDPTDKITQTIEDFGYQGAGVIEQPNIGFVRIYVKETPVSLLPASSRK